MPGSTSFSSFFVADGLFGFLLGFGAGFAGLRSCKGLKGWVWLCELIMVSQITA